jgi:hypothetical protein
MSRQALGLRRRESARLCDFFQNFQRALQDVGSALERRVELLECFIPLALTLEHLKSAHLFFKDGSLGLEQEIVSGE